MWYVFDIILILSLYIPEIFQKKWQALCLQDFVQATSFNIPSKSQDMWLLLGLLQVSIQNHLPAVNYYLEKKRPVSDTLFMTLSLDLKKFRNKYNTCDSGKEKEQIEIRI